MKIRRTLTKWIAKESSARTNYITPSDSVIIWRSTRRRCVPTTKNIQDIVRGPPQNLPTMNIFSIPFLTSSGPCDAKLLMLLIAGYRYAGYSSAFPSLRLSDASYVDELIDASEPYAIKLLWEMPESVGTMGGLMPRSLQYAVPHLPAWWRLHSSRSPPPRTTHYAMSTNISNLLLTLLCADVSKLLQ